MRIAGVDILQGTKNQWMMGNDRLHGKGFGFGQSRRGHVKSDQDPFQGSRRITGLKADIIPIFSKRRGVVRMDEADEVLDAGGISSLHYCPKKESATCR